MLFLFLKIGDSFAGIKGAILVDETAIYAFQASDFPPNSAQTGVRIGRPESRGECWIQEIVQPVPKNFFLLIAW
jgi:hypothetical protein